jgi:anti-sigma regulatory factor (Ser/Thr protein kinase)
VSRILPPVTSRARPDPDHAPGGQGTAEGHGGESASLKLAAHITAPGQARHFARQRLQEWRWPPDEIRTAELVISELMTNSVRACGAVPGEPARPDDQNSQPVSLTLRLHPGQLLIEVTDPGSGQPAPAEPGLDAESGRGLMLVQACSQEWGCHTLPSGGKTVYAVLGLPDSDGLPGDD